MLLAVRWGPLANQKSPRVHGMCVKGVQRGTEGAEKVCRRCMEEVVYHWLPLATIDIEGDNREFEV